MFLLHSTMFLEHWGTSGKCNNVFLCLFRSTAGSATWLSIPFDNSWFLRFFIRVVPEVVPHHHVLDNSCSVAVAVIGSPNSSGLATLPHHLCHIHHELPKYMTLYVSCGPPSASHGPPNNRGGAPARPPAPTKCSVWETALNYAVQVPSTEIQRNPKLCVIHP